VAHGWWHQQLQQQEVEGAQLVLGAAASKAAAAPVRMCQKHTLNWCTITAVEELAYAANV
jgi:hypothetical protein